MSVFRPKKQVPNTSVEIIDKEIGRLEILGVIEKKNDYSQWAAPTAYVKKKNYNLRTLFNWT